MSVRFCDVVRYIQNCDISDLEAIKEEVEFHIFLNTSPASKKENHGICAGMSNDVRCCEQDRR